jgi:signal-transduction protein with cAMP-binding, CBS, and nucleotidyltransferase domain
MATEVIQASLNACGISLARLMSENQVSCVVIVEESDSSIHLPVGIVTERDIVQFQALGVRLSEIKAYEVMSTPLFLLKPSDSLWMAHQEMQRRHVRRLVVSWDWGQGLGIVTQTSLLRVFDPMEMYGVIETLQRTVEQLEAQKSRELLS